MLSSVDLPHPDGPMTATNSPLVISKATPSSAVVSSSAVRYFFVIRDNLITLPPSPLLGSHELDAVEALETLVARRDDAFAVAQALEHLDALGVAPTEADCALLGETVRLVDDEHPLPARVVVEGAVRQHEHLGRLTDLEPHAQRLATANLRRRLADELEPDLELPVPNVRVLLDDRE